MGAKRTKFPRYSPPPRRGGERQRKTWIVLREIADRVEQTASRRKLDESEIVMRAIEQYLPAEPRKRTPRDVAGVEAAAAGGDEAAPA